MKGTRQQKLMDVPQPGGLNQPSPTGLGGVNVRPNQPPAAGPAAPAAGSQEELIRTPARPGQTGQTAQPAQEPRLNSIPRIDDEFPVADLVRATGTGENIAATSLGERFYRRYGRYPTEVDLSILNLRRKFEHDVGQPPTRDELLQTLRNNMVNRQDEML